MLWKPYAAGLAAFPLRSSIVKLPIGCCVSNSCSYVAPYEKEDKDCHSMEKMGEGGGGGGPCLDVMGVKSGSRRQLRLGRLFAKELGDIIHHGRRPFRISDDTRAKISIVDVEVSPDSRNANVWFSCYGDRLEKRQATRWCYLVTDQIRHSLSRRLRHLKTIPHLQFIETDLGRAVDLMDLIEKNSARDASLFEDMAFQD